MEVPGQFFPFVRLPVELRTKVYRCVLISRLDYGPRTNIWRPIAADNGVFKIGFFEKGTVLSILLLSRQIHAEAAIVLYGENTFIFHISGFVEGPIGFLDKLSPQYMRLLRRVYIRTGYYVCNPPDGYGTHSYAGPSGEEAVVQYRRDVAISVALVRQAWPMRYNKIYVDTQSVGLRAEPGISERIKELRGFIGFEEWSASSWYLWQMVTTEPDAEEPRREFRCIDWQISTPFREIERLVVDKHI